MANPNAEDALLNQQSVDFGSRLKYVREYNGLSQRELAKRAGVPHSSISMIEQGLNSPSINSLAKILGGIPMSIAQFFSCDISFLSEQIFRAADLQIKQQKISETQWLQIIPLHNNATATCFEKRIYSTKSDTGDIPQYSVQATSGFIIQGSIELTINSEVSMLVTGDAFALGAMQPYRLRNLSGIDNCIILTCMC